MQNLKTLLALRVAQQQQQQCSCVGARALSRRQVHVARAAATASGGSSNNKRPPNTVAARHQSTTRANRAASRPQTQLYAAADTDAELDTPDVELQLEPQLDTHKFVGRHIGPREDDVRAMLDTLGYETLDALIADTIPSQIMLDKHLRLPGALSEHELVDELQQLANENEASQWRTFIGQGYYKCITPPAIMRNVFENPGWTTAYTAYQAEIAQGRLESLMNYQTMVASLTALDVANASLLDESTAAAEALQVSSRYHKSKRRKWLVSSRCHPQTRAVVETRARPLDVQVDYFDELCGDEKQLFDAQNLSEYSGVLVQYPNTHGHLFDVERVARKCRDADTLLVCATDLMACALFKPPGELGADMAVGSSQRFGVPLNYGGPHAAFMACSQRLLRLIPGRVVGLTRDSNGARAYRFALQTREQHIRRDKATSNICTAQALLANIAAMYAVYHGPQGLRQIARSIHAKAALLARLTNNAGQLQLDNEDNYFDTLTWRAASSEALAQVRERARAAKINLCYEPQAQLVSVALDEATRLSDLLQLAQIIAPRSGSSDNVEATQQQQVAPVDGPLRHLKRESQFLQHKTFQTHRSEAQLVRYMKQLENKDVSLTHSMIPLGSCTMKLNATSQMLASSWPQFADVHPFQPAEQCRGYARLFRELDEYLCEITGYDKISFQPNSGAQGEYAGLRVIKSYLESRGETQRNVCLIPVSAHGTNPASAQMAGFRIQTIKVRDGDGTIDMDDLRAQIDKHREQLACLMITYPSTFGVFEDTVREVCDLVHDAGAQVYLDGANMNAQVGLCRPGDYGSDVSHLNLHKTFCIPHGGGGPGAGPIGVKRHLAPFLPSHPLVGGDVDDDNKSFGSVSASMWGSPAILPISWAYIRMMSGELRRASQVAILNANYMRKRLQNDYKILFQGSRGNVAHEFIIDCRPFKKSANVEAIDIAKRLQDFGLHAPTVSWPVANTLMLEPTESEDKHELDRYCDALLAIRREIADIEQGRADTQCNPIKMAPHTQQIVCANEWTRPYSRQQAAFPANFVQPQTKLWPSVGRVDDTYGDTNLFCSCPPPEQL